MRGKSMILIVIALGCGLVASIGISQILDGRGGPTASNVETRKIYVAVKDVDISQILDAETIKLEEWPVEKIPEGAVTSLEEVKGLSPNQRLYSGEPIRKEKLVDPTKRGGEAHRIPKGFRVQAVKVKAEDVAGNLIAPGDHVDVIVYLRKGGNIPETVTKTFMEDVRVFAVNQTTSREQDEEGNKISAKTVSLLVKPAQVQELLLASRLGQISLSLRRPDDEQLVDTTQGTTISEFFTGAAVDGTPREKSAGLPAVSTQAAKSAASDFKSWLDTVTAEAAATKADRGPADQVASEVWGIQMLTPSGVVNFEVANNDTVFGARQITAGTQLAPAPAAPTAPAVTPDLDTAPLDDASSAEGDDAAQSDVAESSDDAESAADDGDNADSASGDDDGSDG